MSKGPEGDREEGEIVDDEFEEISDSSMILNETGKSLSPKEYLPVISLSSVTDSEDECRPIHMRKFRRIHEKFRHTHRHHNHHHKWRRKMKGKCHKKWKRNFNSDSDNNDFIDLELDKRLQTQLKAAVTVETEDIQKNSLKARLKAMTNLDTEVETTNNNINVNNECQVEESKVFTSEGSEEAENELELRLEALRTAIVNKYEHRKKRKVREMEENQETIKSDNLEINKENTVNENVSDNVKKPCLEKEDLNSTPPEEDEDVLRALLLASISKKITKDVKIPKVEIPSKNLSEPNSIPVKPNIFVKKTVVPFKHHIPQKIKPIIININSDSDSEDEMNQSLINDKDETVCVKKNISDIENTVDRFLKVERAKVEAKNVPVSQNQEVTLKEKISRKPIALNMPKLKESKTNQNESAVLEKSSVKLLPKVKQIEYHKLLLRLKNAQKAPRIRRASFKGSIENSTLKTKIHGCGFNKVADINESARSLHIALKQMQKQINGRLQIEEKYVVLTPIIKKINEETTERKKCDQEVKRLMAELADAKKRLHETQKSFSMYVKELLTMKNEIDKSPPKRKIQKNGQSKVPVTSTPLKIKPPTVSINISTVTNTPNTSADPTSETNVKLSLAASESMPIEKYSDRPCEIKFKIQATKEKDIIFKMSGDKMTEDGIVANDSDKNGIKEEINPENDDKNVTNYVSPLDSVKRNGNHDPFVIMCPYDMDGNCRDVGCTYKHYSR